MVTVAGCWKRPPLTSDGGAVSLEAFSDPDLDDAEMIWTRSSRYVTTTDQCLPVPCSGEPMPGDQGLADKRRSIGTPQAAERAVQRYRQGYQCFSSWAGRTIMRTTIS